MRVLLADNEIQVRSALRLFLEQEPEIQVAAEVADGASLQSYPEIERVDLVLVDWELPDLQNTRLSAWRALHPKIKIIALSGDPEVRSVALASGLDGFIDKGDPPEAVQAAVQSVSVKL